MVDTSNSFVPSKYSLYKLTQYKDYLTEIIVHVWQIRKMRYSSFPVKG